MSDKRSSLSIAERFSRRVEHRKAVAGSYQRAAERYDVAHGDQRSRARFAVIEKPMLAATRGAARVLELGCGTGRLLAQVRAPVRVGIDIAPAMLARARAHIDHLAVADAHCLPFSAGSFDAIIAGKGVFRYLDYRYAFAECARVLTPGGRLAIHQYAARTWTLKSLLAPRVLNANNHLAPAATGVTEVDRLSDLHNPAVRAGLRPVGVWLWRSVRVRPYIVAVPKWLPGRAWSHCVLLFDRH